MYYLILYFFVYGFLGWCTEVAFADLQRAKICEQRIFESYDLPDLWYWRWNCCAIFNAV